MKKQQKVKVYKEKTKYSWSRGNGRRRQEKPQDSKGALLFLLRYVQPFIPLLLLVLVFSVATSLLTIKSPQYLELVMDTLVKQLDNKLAGGEFSRQAIFAVLRQIVLVIGGAALFAFFQQFILAGITQSIVRTMRGQVNGKLSVLPLRYFDLNSKGDILSRMMNDIENVSNTAQNNIVRLVSSAVTFVGALYMMFQASVPLTLMTFVILPPSLLITLVLSKRSKRYFRQQWDRTGELNGHIEEMFTGHQLVKVFDHEQQSIAEFDDINTELANVSLRAQFISGTVGQVLRFVANTAFLLLYVIGGNYILQGKLTLGGLTAFSLYASMFVQPVVDVGNIMNGLQSSLASAERIFSLLRETDEPPDNPLYQIDAPSGAVRFEDVDFQYVEEKPLIEGLNLDVQPGKLVAIVGPTGAGKTTIVNLLMRFYDVNGGKITVDGHDIREISRENLRTIFGMVLQDTWLFEGSIRDNIAYGRIGAVEEDVLAAAKAARVEHFLSAMPDGIDTQLEEDGSNVSQGQRQLITIARAILADPAILILDEATSSVDTRTELLIQQAMQTLMKGRTSFVIAHRLSTIREADTILVMHDGGIVETGTHNELLALNGFYTEIYNSQFGIAGELVVGEE